jgi:UDP-glucuronate decarboxylase
VKVLVTGGAGFIGRNLINLLVRDGHVVTSFDNYSTGKYDRHLEVSSWEGDVTDFIPDDGWDQIYHLASPASPAAYWADPVGTWKANTIGTLKVLELAKKCGARVVFTSTSEVYGDPECSPQAEDYWGNVNTWGPRACYDESKRAGETLCYEYVKKGVDVRVARIFNTYGPRMAQDDGRVVSNFIVAALLRQKVIIYGDGSQTRSFCYVDDTVEALMGMMKSENPAIAESPTNIGNPDEITIMKLLDEVTKITGAFVVTENLPGRADEPRRRCPDIRRASSVLGWRPVVDLRDGLVETVKYFRRVIEGGRE